MCLIIHFGFFFSSRRRHTRCREVSWARRCVQETAKLSFHKTCSITKFFFHKTCSTNQNLTRLFNDFLKSKMDLCCLLYTSDAADDTPCVDLGGRRIIKKKNHVSTQEKD
eukprot:TRINITY_DN7235_c0_g1_i3.p1 TRINITY_DN7235_c0_g1~~TRINITY_DN7235_c0_g1_i3.p1  ORF type:complete len:125 (-),score=35.73 TRINITY_DN7235_c0_g1_i3:39-368(-)